MNTVTQTSAIDVTGKIELGWEHRFQAGACQNADRLCPVCKDYSSIGPIRLLRQRRLGSTTLAVPLQ